jgi:hypothetical protein
VFEFELICVHLRLSAAGGYMKGLRPPDLSSNIVQQPRKHLIYELHGSLSPLPSAHC